MRKLKTLVVIAALLSARVSALNGFAAEDGQRGPDAGALVGDDMKRLQGAWELRHGNEGKGPPTIRSVKTIVGNRETLRRYSIASGELLSERTVEFRLSQSGPVRVFTFYPVGGEADSGYSYVYKLENNEFYDVTGLLHGAEYRDYSESPSLWRWTRVVEKAPEEAANPATVTTDTPRAAPRD